MSTFFLEQELRSIVPVCDYVDMSTVPTLYLNKFNRKLSQQLGVKKLSKLFEDLPHAFQTKQTLGSDGKASLWSVAQIPQKRVPVITPTASKPPPSKLVVPKIIPTIVPKTIPRTVPQAITKTVAGPAKLVASATIVPVPVVASKQPGTKAVAVSHAIPKVASRVVPVELNDRSEAAVSLSQLTTSFRSPQNSVPLDGLAAFIRAKKAPTRLAKGDSLITRKEMGNARTSGSSILGFTEYDEDLLGPGDSAVFMNTTDPFCAVCIGVQGAGNPQPMCGLVLHYDQSESNCCEAVGLNSPAAPLSLFPGLKVQRLVVLASPTYYLQRKAFYGDTCEVIPLLFDWDTLTATQLKKLMRLSDSDAQLYVSVILNKLREYQRKNKIPSFDGFLDEVMTLCNVQGQNAPLQQRLELLKTVVRESAPNEDLREHSHSLASLMQAGTLVVADLTDPMMSADEACGVFQVLLEQFRGHPLGDVGKVVTFDEAHKYLNKSGPGCVELSNAIVDTVRLMRHEGIRVLISTQSPLTMPPELLELTSVTILHKFQSADWAKYLGSKVTLPPDGFHEIQSLEQGQALLLSTQISASERDGAGESAVVNHLKVNIRPRLTLDLGASRRNRSGADENSAEDFVAESECQSLSPSDAVGSGEEQGTGIEYKDSYEDSDADYGSIKDSEEEPEESQSLWRERLSQSDNDVIGADIDIDTRSFEALRNSAGGERNDTNSAGLLGAEFKELDIGDW
eukprot:gene18780-21373_t